MMLILRSKSVCFLAAACLLMRAVLTAETEVRPLQPLDIFEFEYAGDPTISPDGRHIVYVRHFSDIMTDLRYTNLWLINADGTGHRALTTGNCSRLCCRLHKSAGKHQLWGGFRKRDSLQIPG